MELAFTFTVRTRDTHTYHGASILSFIRMVIFVFAFDFLKIVSAKMMMTTTLYNCCYYNEHKLP